MLFFGLCHTNVDMNEFMKEPSEHSHAPDPNRLHIIRLKNEIKSVEHHRMKELARYYLMSYAQLHWL